MKWIKKGLVLEPKGTLNWQVTHAAVPFADRIEGDLYRIYFAGRDNRNRSQIGYVEIDIKQPQKISYITEKPVLGLGPLGAFDDNGLFPSWIVNYNDKKYLYYVGWMEGKRIRYHSALGLAISKDGGKTFEKFSKAPVIGINNIDPYMILTTCVRIENEKWKMWYTSGVGWEIENDSPKPRYHIRYAESKDGINWERNGIVCIDFKSNDEWAIGRPCVIKENGIYKMWYSYSAGSYRIGYAESNDGIRWKRKDEEVGIDVSESGWDSEMVAYAFIFEHDGKKYMLYNGNNYGKHGFGYAILDENK